MFALFLVIEPSETDSQVFGNKNYSFESLSTMSINAYWIKLCQHKFELILHEKLSHSTRFFIIVGQLIFLCHVLFIASTI